MVIEGIGYHKTYYKNGSKVIFSDANSAVVLIMDRCLAEVLMKLVRQELVCGLITMHYFDQLNTMVWRLQMGFVGTVMRWIGYLTADSGYTYLVIYIQTTQRSTS